MKRTIAVVISLLLLLAVAAGIWKSRQTSSDAATSPTAAIGDLLAKPTKTLRLLTGSAKFSLLQDPDMVALLKQEGIKLELSKSGAFEQDKAKLEEFDAIWPAGANQAADWAALIPGASNIPVMSTPLALASWSALMPVLEKNGLAKMSGKTHGDFHLEKALPLMLAGKRWNQLQDNTVFAVNKSFLINTPDLRKSNTSALYVAALAYLHNNQEVPQSRDKAEQLAKDLTPLITRQGFQESTLAGPFEDYLGQGMGKAPLVLIYESQFVEARLAKKLRDSHILLYPQPGLVMKHILIGRTEGGKQLGQILANNPQAQKIIARYGFRTNDPALFAAQSKELSLDAPDLINLVETPNTVILDSMVQTIVNSMENK